MKHGFPIRIYDLYLSEATIHYYKYNKHKPVLKIESAHRFSTRGPIYFMRCVRCRDKLTWKDGKFEHGGVHR